jgi:hypothetical protein
LEIEDVLAGGLTSFVDTAGWLAVSEHGLDDEGDESGKLLLEAEGRARSSEGWEGLRVEEGEGRFAAELRPIEREDVAEGVPDEMVQAFWRAGSK